MPVVTRVLDTPTDRVLGRLLDVRGWAAWLPTVEEVTPVEPDRPDEVGAAYLVRQPRLGTARWRITAWEPGRGFTWVSQRPGLTTTGEHRVVPEDGRCRVDLSITWSGPLAPVARALYGRLARSYVEQEAASLAALP